MAKKIETLRTSNQDLVDKCAIWQKGEEIIADLGRSFPGFPHIIAELLQSGVAPEKVTYEAVTGMYIDRFGKQISLDKCIKKYNLR